MPPVIVPPTGNGAAQTLMLLFLRTEQKLLQEIKRKRESNFVDYAEVAALFRVRKDLSRMMQGAEKYAPMAIEHEFFYEGGKHRAGYKNAMSAVNPGRTLAIEQLVDNLLGEVREAAETAYQTTQNAIYLLGRIEPDIFRTEGIKQAVEALTEGVGPMTKTNALVKAIEGEGITAFTDKAGRDWDLHSYGNMAVRTTVRQAQVSAVLTEDDHDLYQISKIGTTCPVCAIYEGRVYSKSGTNPNYPPLSAAFGKIDPAGADDLSNTFLNIHPNCLVPGGLVLAEGVVSESRRLYTGKVITLSTSTGNEITVTPNHPILTDRGFVAADLLHEGDKIIEASGKYRGLLGQTPNDVNIPTPVDKVFHTLMQTGGGSTCRVKCTSVQFHGDGIPNSEVEIVFSNGFGNGKGDVLGNKPITEQRFPTAQCGRLALLADGSALKILNCTFRAFNGIMRRIGFIRSAEGNAENGHNFANLRIGTTTLFSDLGICQPLIVEGKKCVKHFSMFFKKFLGNICESFPSLPTFGAADAVIGFSPSDDVIGNTEMLRNLRTGETTVDERLQYFGSNDGLVISQLAHKACSFYEGYVYNLETEHRFYTYNNIVTHNCLHSVRKFTEASKTPEQLRKIREFSSFTTNPATNDPRSKKQIAAYREKERNRAKLREDVKQWRKYMAAGVEGVPKDFATFRKWKEAQNDKYHELMSAYRKRDKK